jgi:nitroreductase
MELLEGLYTRRSVREFTGEAVTPDELMEVVKAGTWAPSGLNNQPWRFALVTDAGVRAEMAKLTNYGHIIEGAAAVIAVFIDREAMYHEVKDHQAMGACIQNILLAAHGLGLGGVWLGEILKSAAEVRALLGLPDNLEFMAAVAVGHPTEKKRRSTRKPLEEVVVREV